MKKVRQKNRSLESSGQDAAGPQRTCVGCRKSLDQGQLVRYVLSPQGHVVVDYRKKLPGRGVYTCLNRDCVEKAVTRGQLSRGLRAPGAVPTVDEIWGALYEQVVQRVANLLCMARKAGQVFSGTRQVLIHLQGGVDCALLIRAVDLAEEGTERIDNAARRSKVPCFVLFSKDRLGHLLGKSERGVVALKNGSLADAVRKELERLNIFAGEFNG